MPALRPEADIPTRAPRLRDRVAARTRAHALDTELAHGAPPHLTPALALRARALSRPSQRAALARTLNEIVREARGARRRRLARVPVIKSEVLAATAQLTAVSRRLVAPGAIAAGGVASARLLLSDGSGPLYFAGAADDLSAAIAQVLEALGPVPDAAGA
jgi:hypothetical protein